MRLALPGSPHLTYCTNIHAGESWAEIFAALRKYVPGIKARVSAEAPMGLGLRLSAAAADELSSPRALAELQSFLREADLYVFTVNAFPYGAFHATRVKEQVYEPDWRTEARLQFTDRAADILAQLLPSGIEGSISTVPGAFKDAIKTEADVEAMVQTLLRHAAHLHALRRDTGKSIVLALEPEPCCFIETIAEAIAFFNGRLFARSSIDVFARLANVPAEQAEAAMRRHLGVCLDVCHAAVEFEDPTECVAHLEAAGIRVPKIQLSSALRVPSVDARAIELLRSFDDGIYLHQTVADGEGSLTRYTDLPDAIAAHRGGAASGEWRVHCHVPLFRADYGALQSTQQQLAELLAACRARAMAPHLEVETYTWDVLPADIREGDIGDDIARELTWVRSQLGA
ncbi:MAG TPA: metabolite traffic protein EboE [Hyphomicrobium sp.]|nr:metabolite traffic protein EboE [Hyphomicrobium sp.]